MATFAKASFNAAIYSSFRPTYPPALFEHIYRFHASSPLARWDRAVDVGCGTGQASTALLSPNAGGKGFERVLGVDPSENMIKSANENPNHVDLIKEGRLRFVQGNAEDLKDVEDASADCIVAAQAAHWFDWSKQWKESARVLRVGGTAAFWAYSEFRLTEHPQLTPLITAYAQGESNDPRTSLGPHWQRPGRTILERHLVDIPDADKTSFGPMERVYFTGSHYPDLPSPHPVIMRKKMTWDDLYAYFETWSSLHTFRGLYPEDAQNDGGIARRFWKTLNEGAGVGTDGLVEVEWPLALIMAKRVD